jgi:anhydro-N-acetylmuramic acid kinase
MWAIGLMSGTSLDGVDVALIETDGEAIQNLGPTGYRPYGRAEREVLAQALDDAVALTRRDERPGVLAEAERLVTDAHAEAVEHFLGQHGIGRRQIDVIGFHGQTVLHRPESRLTVQLGDGAALASRLGMQVVHDLRAADVAAGGQGAPLVPVYHRALVRGTGRNGPVAVLNLGGVANVTLVDGEREPAACDLGPGNALLDDFMKARTGEAIDRDGRVAAAGKVDHGRVERLLAHPFFARPAPKSLDRNDFRHWVAERGGLEDLSTADGAATLTALTAAGVASILPWLASRPLSWIVAGGGARNPTLMKMLAARLAPARVDGAGDLGWSSDHVEAQAFAYLAVRSLRGLPLTFPATTGVATPLSGGVLSRPGEARDQTMVSPMAASRLST